MPSTELSSGAILRNDATSDRKVSLMRNVLHAVAVVVTMMALASSTHAAGVDQKGFTQVAPQFIPALGDPAAKSGNNAQTWGLWRVDPGPRGVPLTRYQRLIEVGGVAPAKWAFDGEGWWLWEHGLIMEKPTFPLAPGKYLVTGDREVTAVLTVYRPDKDGNQRWELSDGAKLNDVTHLA